MVLVRILIMSKSGFEDEVIVIVIVIEFLVSQAKKCSS
jgi:hypothetical protein